MFRRSPTLALVAALSAATLASSTAGPAAHAQEPTADSRPELFLESVDVDVVELEVIVTDRQGNPVRGLSREDFRIFEDGQPVELTNFYAVEGARRVLPAEEAAAAAADPSAAALPPDQLLNLAVAVDNANIQPPNRKRVLDQLKLHLSKVVRPGDRVMVIGMDRSIRVEQSLTEDMSAVLAAIDRLAESTAGRVDLFAQERMIRNAIATQDGAASGGAGGGGGFAAESLDSPAEASDRVLAMIQSYGAQADARSRQTFEAIGQLIDSMAGLEGRNAVLYVSDGIATRPVEAMLDEFSLQFGSAIGTFSPTLEANRWDSSDMMRRVAKKAAADQVVFYSMDAKGLAGSSGIELYSLSAPGTTGSIALSEKDAMMFLAASTGGDVMLNPANVAALVDRMASDYSDYYSLGYTSPKSQDGKYHRIEVRVPGRDGARVRHTEGYQGKDANQRMIERTLSALVFDVAYNPLDVRLEIGGEQDDTRKQLVLPLLVRVPISNLVLIPRSRSHQGKVTIYLAVQDQEGRVIQPDPIEVPVDIPNDQLLDALSRELGHGLNLQLRKGETKLAIGVRDDVAAVESTVNLNVSLGEG